MKKPLLAIAALAASAILPVCGQRVPVIQAGAAKATFREDGELTGSNWNISPAIRPDVYDTYIQGRSKRVTFITDKDSIAFDVQPGQRYPFVVMLSGKDSAFTEIRGYKLLPRAHFSKAYQTAHRGKTFVEIPEVYELLNVVFALTEPGRSSTSGLIYNGTEYYQEVMQWFNPYADHPAVKSVGKAIAGDGAYHAMKMDAYAFELAPGDSIVQSPVYNRIGRSETNNLAYFIPELQSFAKASRFHEFYQRHQPYYEQLTRTFRDSVGVPEMQKWLTRNFPSTRYDSFKIIFSPLVSANQSASWFDYDGFHEAQAHVNFPFRNAGNPDGWSRGAMNVQDGNIVFTELNHSFIGPEGDKPAYRKRIHHAFADLTKWNDASKPARHYDTPQASFDEYMNWALVSLRYIDYAPAAEQDRLIARNEEMMVTRRGFLRFREFDQFLVKTYRSRKKGQTVADLYPAIVEWFEKQQP